MVFYFLKNLKICNEKYDESTFPFTFGFTFKDLKSLIIVVCELSVK